MNILPKKSWHVRAKKNIERIRRDEAEAERLKNIEQERILQVEQEVRVRELRLRQSLPESSSSGHLNLFKDSYEQSTSSKELEERRTQEEQKSRQAFGSSNQFGRPSDLGRPWYCQRDSRTNLISQKSPGGTCKLMAGIKTDKKTGIKLQIVRPEKVITNLVDSESSPEIIKIVDRDEKKHKSHHKKSAKSRKHKKCSKSHKHSKHKHGSNS